MIINSKKILIVDDDERNIFALKAVLHSRSYECATAVSAKQALHILTQAQDIEVALVDVMMPDMDGYELMSKIKSNPDLNNLRVVAVTAQAMPGDKEKCIQAGADAYISKPVDVDKLLDVIRKGE